jgi:hypothetical protein
VFTHAPAGDAVLHLGHIPLDALLRARRTLQAEWDKEPGLADCGGANV